MSRDPLRFYPRAWRERYGDEMSALIADDLDGRAATRRYRAHLAWAGLRERARESGMAGESPASARRWAGSSLVLFAWVGLLAAGGSFAKSSEHFRSALPPAARLAPEAAFLVAAAAGLVGAGAIGIGALVAVPDVARALRHGRLRGARRAVGPALVGSLAVVASTIGLAAWAHHLNGAQRNGADAAYAWAFAAWAAIGVATLALWARFAVRACRTCLSERALQVEARLAVAAAAAAPVLLAASAWWWALMASRAPEFLTGVSGASAVTVRMAGTIGLMLLAVMVASYGAARLARRRDMV